MECDVASQFGIGGLHRECIIWLLIARKHVSDIAVLGSVIVAVHGKLEENLSHAIFVATCATVTFQFLNGSLVLREVELRDDSLSVELGCGREFSGKIVQLFVHGML